MPQVNRMADPGQNLRNWLLGCFIRLIRDFNHLHQDDDKKTAIFRDH